jgi:hypothetical protein
MVRINLPTPSRKVGRIMQRRGLIDGFFVQSRQQSKNSFVVDSHLRWLSGVASQPTGL